MYVLRHTETGEYFTGSKNNPRWETDVNKAGKFKTKEAGFNYINSSRTYLNWLGEEKDKLEAVLIPDAPDLTKEQAEEIFDKMDSAIRILISIADDIDALQKFYAKEDEKFCGIQQDMLHKIEFEGFNGFQAIKFMRDMKKMRLERRKVKNRHDIVNKVATSMNLKSMKVKYDSIETKQYSPRQLPNLFNKGIPEGYHDDLF